MKPDGRTVWGEKWWWWGVGGLLSSLMRADNLPPSTAAFLGTHSVTTFLPLAESAGFPLKLTPASGLTETVTGNDPSSIRRKKIR